MGPWQSPGTCYPACRKRHQSSIASKVVAKLKAKGFTIKMTRSSDVYRQYDRAELTNNIGPDLFVSIHCDSLQSLTMRGYTVYVSRSASQDSRMAAGLVEDAMGATGLSSRGVRQGDYIVLVNTRCPAVLVECGCLSNPREAALLYDGSFQDKIATQLQRHSPGDDQNLTPSFAYQSFD
jgi:N-acetylmuramoyl-L-alanine amidase